MPYHLNSIEVSIASDAEISGPFVPGDDRCINDAVQYALNDLAETGIERHTIKSFPLPRAVGAYAVLLASDEEPLWAINRRNTARKPKVSPHILLDMDDPRRLQTTATLELIRRAGYPILTRIYPGIYMPPLPWMPSASNAPGGMDESVQYWSEHALVAKPGMESLGHQPPQWYKHSKPFFRAKSC